MKQMKGSSHGSCVQKGRRIAPTHLRLVLVPWKMLLLPGALPWKILLLLHPLPWKMSSLRILLWRTMLPMPWTMTTLQPSFVRIPMWTTMVPMSWTMTSLLLSLLPVRLKLRRITIVPMALIQAMRRQHLPLRQRLPDFVQRFSAQCLLSRRSMTLLVTVAQIVQMPCCKSKIH